MKAPGNIEMYRFRYSAKSFWKKLEKVGKSVGIKTVYASLVLYYALNSPGVSNKERGVILGALGYFILPLDLIPDFIPGAGFTDDIAALMFAIYKVARCITPEVKDQARTKIFEWFGPVSESELDLELKEENEPSVHWDSEE